MENQRMQNKRTICKTSVPYGKRVYYVKPMYHSANLPGFWEKRTKSRNLSELVMWTMIKKTGVSNGKRVYHMENARNLSRLVFGGFLVWKVDVITGLGLEG